MSALSAPVLSHLDPYVMTAMDDIRQRLSRLFLARQGAVTLAISGTGTSAMEAAVANVTRPDPGPSSLSRATSVTGWRRCWSDTVLASVALDVEWGRACDPSVVEAALKEDGADLIGIVHAETSTGVLNPVDDIARLAAAHGALLIADAVTSFGAMPLNTGTWGASVCYSCAQKGLGAPSGLSPITFSSEAAAARTQSRSFYFDLSLLESYWMDRKYHHTISSPLVLALREALTVVEEEGLAPRHARHRANHQRARSRSGSAGSRLAAARGRTTLDAQRRARTSRRRRSRCQAPTAAGVRHRDRRRARSPGRAYLARWSDGRRISPVQRVDLPRALEHSLRANGASLPTISPAVAAATEAWTKNQR